MNIKSDSSFSYDSFLSKFLGLVFLFFLFFRIDSILIFGSDFKIYYVLSIVFLFFVFFIRFNFSFIFCLFVFLFFWMFFVVVYDYFFVVNTYDFKGESQLHYRLAIFRNAVVFYFMGFVFASFHIFYVVKSYKKFINFLFFLTLSIFLFYSNNFSVDYALISSSVSGRWVNHLYFGSAVVLLSAIFVSIGSSSLRKIKACIVVFLLWILGGGSAFFLSFLSYLGVFFLFYLKGRLVYVLLFSILVCVFTPVFSFYAFHLDASFLERLKIFNAGFKYLGEQFYIGAPELILEYSDGYGGYFHNFFSMYQFYGFVPFFLLFLIFLFFVFKVIMDKESMREGTDFLFFYSFIVIYSFLSFILSKFIGEWLIWFSLGMSTCVSSKNFRFF